MTGSLRLRRFRSDDRERAIELHEEAMRAVGAYEKGVAEPDLDDVEGAYFETGGTFLVGEVDGRIVATGAFRPATGYLTELLEGGDGRTAELKRLRVDPAFQRQGYGGRLYDELERRVRADGFAEIVLDTTPGQTGARRFFERNSFEEVLRTEVRPGEEPFVLLVYRKSLTTPR